MSTHCYTCFLWVTLQVGNADTAVTQSSKKWLNPDVRRMRKSVEHGKRGNTCHKSHKHGWWNGLRGKSELLYVGLTAFAPPLLGKPAGCRWEKPACFGGVDPLPSQIPGSLGQALLKDATSYWPVLPWNRSTGWPTTGASDKDIAGNDQNPLCWEFLGVRGWWHWGPSRESPECFPISLNA